MLPVGFIHRYYSSDVTRGSSPPVVQTRLRVTKLHSFFRWTSVHGIGPAKRPPSPRARARVAICETWQCATNVHSSFLVRVEQIARVYTSYQGVDSIVLRESAVAVRDPTEYQSQRFARAPPEQCLLLLAVFIRPLTTTRWGGGCTTISYRRIVIRSIICAVLITVIVILRTMVNLFIVFSPTITPSQVRCLPIRSYQSRCISVNSIGDQSE